MTITTQRIEKCGNVSFTLTCWVDVTGMTLTVACGTGLYYANHIMNSAHSVQERAMYSRFVDGCTSHSPSRDTNERINSNVSWWSTHGNPLTGELCGQTLKIQSRVDQATGTYYGSSCRFSHIEVLEIS